MSVYSLAFYGELIALLLEGNVPTYVRTVTPQQFDVIRQDLMNGSVCIPSPGNYGGATFQRLGGVTFGLRNSKENGLTIDIFKTPASSLYGNIRKVPQQ